MCGWLTFATARASRAKRCVCRGLPDPGERILIATIRSRRVSLARYTSPIPPAPSGATIEYGPNCVPIMIDVTSGKRLYLIPIEREVYPGERCFSAAVQSTTTVMADRDGPPTG